MATSDEWSRVGFSGNPVTGNPAVVEGIAKELRDLSDLAGRVSGGLDTLLTKAEDGGFEGRTADALRKYVKEELKTFMENVNRSFDMAATATARYARALGDAQDRAENAADTVAALERVGGQPLAEDDPELTRARNEADAEVDAIQAEAKILEDTLREAARLVSRPVKKPKKSFWKRFVSTFFKVLEIVTLVLTLVAAVVTGPLGLVAFGLGAVLFVKAVVDYAMGNGNALSLGLAFLGILFPSTKGLTTVGGLARMASSGAKAMSGALGASGRLLFRGGRMLFSPRALLTLTGQGLARFAGGLGGLGSRAVTGLSTLGRVFSRAPGMLMSALRYMGGFARSTWQRGRSALSRDFYQSTAFVGGNMGLKVGVFSIMSMSRLTVSALLPMRYSEIARFGYAGAARMGFIERGLSFAPRSAGTLGRTGALGADLAELTNRGLNPAGNLRPAGDTAAGKFAVPGTPEFNDTLDELADIAVTPITAPRTPGFSSLTGPGSVRMPGRLDDMGVRPNSLDTLDTVGLPVGTVPVGQRLDLVNLVNGRPVDELMSPQLRTTLTTFDQFDELGAPIGPGSPVALLPPRNAVDQLRDLDTLTGLERTEAGLLKPIDELADLADLSLDGKLGGLTEFQVRQVLDGEIDLVNVTPDGLVVRIGKTDPIDVRVQLKDGVTVSVLGPADTRVPTLNSTTGPGRLDELGIQLDDLTRLIPDTTDGARTARELLGLGPVKTDLVADPVTTTPSFTPLTLRDIVTGGATGKLAADRFQAWVRTQSAQFGLDTAGRELSEIGELTDVPPLGRAQAELDLSAAKLEFNQARIDFDRLGMNLDMVNRDIVVMTTRVDGPVATLPTGELRLLDGLGRPTGQWITMEPGQSITWVLKTDSGVVPDARVQMTDGVFTVTAPDGVVTRFGADGRPAGLGDLGSVSLPPSPRTSLDEVVLPAPGELDRLAFAADRSVDIQTISPPPVWRGTDETLWRIGGRRGLDQIFTEGFTVRDPLETSLDVMVRTGQPSAFVSTTTDKNLLWDGIFKFEIEASGGIDIGKTFERSMGTEAWRTSGWASENEIAFPGGIAPDFIRGAYRMDAQHNLLEWIPNPNFKGSNPLPELAADLKVPGEGTSGISALDFQGLSVDDQLKLLDQLDLGGAKGWDEVNSLDGANSLDEINSLDGFNYLDEAGGELDLGYLSDEFRLDRFDAPAPRGETVLLDPQQFSGVPGMRMEWQRTPLDDGGFALADLAGDTRLVFTADEVLQFRDVRFPLGDGFLRFDANPGPGALPRVVGQDGLPLPGGAVIEPVRDALNVVTGVRVQSLDGAWIGRFDLAGTRLSEQVALSGLNGGPLTGARLTTTFTQLPGGGPAQAPRLTVPGLGEGAFSVVRLDGDLAQRLPGGVAVTDTATGARFVFDRGGRFVDLPVDGATPTRLDVSGSGVPETSVGRLTAIDNLDSLGSGLGELGTLNRLTLPDLPGTNLMPETVGFDARLGATVTDGAPTPVNLSRFDGMSLSGADELTNLRLRVTELPATELSAASFRIDVVDFGAPGGPVRLQDATVTVREGGGLGITGPQGGVRWQFDAMGHLEYRELPLSGTDFALRFTDEALNPMPVVGRDGVSVPGAAVTPVRDATGALSELTVRVPMPGTDGLTAVWRYEPGGLLRQQELPITLPGLDGPSGLGIKVTVTPGAGGTTTRVFELTGPSNLTGSLRLTSMDGSLAGRLPNGFTVADMVTGSRFHFDGSGRLAIRDLPAPDGSGFLRFTEGAAPGTPPVRLDDLGNAGLELDDITQIFNRTLDEAGGVRGPLEGLNRLTGPDAPSISSLPEFSDLGLEERALVDDLWSGMVQDVRPVSSDELNRVVGPDSPRTDSVSELSGLPDPDLAALQARLDNLRQLGGEPRQPDELIHVPLSGVDDLADFDLRVTRLPATDATPQGSYRLELADRTPGGAGPVRVSDFTVELLDGSGRFAVIDPTGTTRFTFGPDGSFLGRETALAFDGLPEGLRLNVTINPGVDGTGRVMVDVLGPAGATRSVQLTPTSGTLAGRLPSGFTLTDTLTGSRFHFDHTGRLAFRDLPDRDGSGFLRFTEGAAPGTPPVRLDELGDFGGDLGERFPLGSVPEDEVLDGVLDDALDGVDMARFFDRTLDEASGLRTVPEGASANLTDIAGAMDFLRVAPDSHAFQSLDLPGLQRLADDATASLDRFGLRPELLNDQLRQLTGQAQQMLRQHAVTTLGDYLNLPLATRLDDLQSVAQGGGGRVIGDFTVTPTPHGGPGGSRYTVVHNPSDMTLGFGPNRELLYQEVVLRGGPSDLDGLKLGITGRSADGGPWTPSSLDFVGARPADGLFTTAPNPRGGFTITDAASTTTWHYGPEGVVALRDVQLPGDRGVLRFDADAPGGVPQVLDPAGGGQLPGLRVELLDEGRIALAPAGKGAQPLERTVFDPSGTLLEETIAIRGKGGVPTGEYWKIDHAAGNAVRIDASGTPLTGRFDTATLEKSGTGQFRLTGTQPGKVTLFERETFKNGNVLHIDRDRFGHARWTEFDSPGTTFRHGERIADADMRTFHDVPSGSWRRLINNSGDVRTYTKGVDGGLVRAEKGSDGHWTWQRFDKEGAESLSGTRHWSRDHVGFKDTYVDPATGVDTVAQRRGMTWPFGGEHGSRMYQEHSVVPGHAPAGGRVDPGMYTGYGAFNAQIESLETLADGGSLLVKRYADMRPPAFLWKSAAGRSRFDGFFRDLFAGDSLHRVSFWTETAADGTKVTGVRLNPSGSNWVDIDQYGRIVRETRKLDNGNVIEVGRSLEDPTRWASVPAYRKGGSYELSWRDTTSGTTGTRHVDGNGRWRDLFTDENGVERVRLRSEGRNTREYLFEAPSTRDLSVNDNAGVWVDKNSLLHVTGRRDLINGQIVESSGSPYRTTWKWQAFSTDDPATVVAEGVRKQNRGSFYSKTWDDSFVDLDQLGSRVHERNATDTAGTWVDAVKQSDGTWKWTKTAADGTVHSEGTRVYDDIAGGGHWRDNVDGQVVRQREGGRVREFDYKIVTPQLPALTTTGSLRDLLAQAARQFEPPTRVEVNPQVWKEYDLGKVFRERVAVDGTPGRYREVDKQWGQWREFQDGHLVEQRTFTGRVWKTDAFGRWSTSGPAMIPEYLARALPRMGDEIGLPGDRGWQLIGRETDFRGAEIEALGLLREVQDPWHGVFTGVRDGVSAEMPVWQRELRAALTTFSTGFVTDFTASLLITELTNTGNLKREDYFKALLTGAVGGTFSGGLNVLYNRTSLGYFKNSLGARDWGAHPKQSMQGNTDDWATDWAAQEKPTRWRSATYANTVGIGTSALSGFVANAISASVFGINGNEVKGADALLAGLYGAGASAFSGVTTGLARNAFHLTTGSRVFHKGGLPELGVNWAESALSRYISWLIIEEDKKNGNNLPSPSQAFPKQPTTTTPSTTAPADQQQPASDPAALLTDGLEFP